MNFISVLFFGGLILLKISVLTYHLYYNDYPLLPLIPLCLFIIGLYKFSKLKN
jgi:hypothetical protein